jgi:5-methylcytosine-specific restriction protein B
MPIPDGITREDVLQAIRDLDAGAPADFGDSKKYDLVFEGKRYAPKAVVGLAARRVLGRALTFSEFSGGEGSANPLLRQLGLEIVPKGGSVVDAGEPTGEDEADRIRMLLAAVVEEWRATNPSEPFSQESSWLENRDAVTSALDRLNATGDLSAFSVAIAAAPNQPPWFKVGAHKSFLGTLADRATRPDAATTIHSAFSAPVDRADAAAKINSLIALAEETERLYPGPGFAPLALSHVWCFQDPDSWPFLSVDAESALWGFRLLAKDLPAAGRYLRLLDILELSPAPALETSFALGRVHSKGWRSLSPSVYARLKENGELLTGWYESNTYSSDSDKLRAERNINAVLGEFDLLARGMNDEIASKLVRDLVTSKTDPRVGFDANLPFRADAYAIHTIEKNMLMPSIRVWATGHGLGIGAHFGSQKPYDEYAGMAGRLQQIGLPDGVQFFEVLAHREGNRIRPIGSNPPKGELFVGEWFEGGLTGADVGEQVMRTVAKLQPIFDAMVVSAGEAPNPTPPGDDPLTPLVAEFHATTGYPSDADRTDRAEREEMAKVISEDGLLAFDLHEVRRIYNTGRYGSPGPQSILNASLGQMIPAELDAFANNLEYLLRGSDPLEQRVNALMDQSIRGVKGFGEAVITKLLAIEYPSEILPLFVYRGAMGKGVMLKLLELHEEGLEGLDTGTRLVRSNELLRDRLRPFFGDDTFGMSRFLYWLSDRPEPGEEPIDEIDHIGNLADKVLVTRETIVEMVSLLEDKGQIIFYGPPGTGKTFLARELSKALAPDPAQRMLVQFHPSTSYEDFFEGYRPETDAQNRLTYRLVKGPLALIAERAKDNPSKKYVMVIDEINRANLPKVFGELLFLLEYREETIRSLYRPDEPFELPKNLWIIGTMNTADRSIALVDAAMRRRFHFVGFFPNEGLMSGLLREWLRVNREPDWVADLLDMVNDELRDHLGGPHLQIGPSHFMRPGLTDAALKQVWTFSVFPFIEEQLYGNQGLVRDYEFVRVMKRFQAKVAPVDELEEGGDDNSPAPGME